MMLCFARYRRAGAMFVSLPRGQSAETGNVFSGFDEIRAGITCGKSGERLVSIKLEHAASPDTAKQFFGGWGYLCRMASRSFCSSPSMCGDAVSTRGKSCRTHDALKQLCGELEGRAKEAGRQRSVLSCISPEGYRSPSGAV